MKIGIQTNGVFEPLGTEKGLAAIAAAGFDCIDLNLESLTELSWEELRAGKPSPFFFSSERVDDFIRRTKAVLSETGLSVGQAHAPTPLHFRNCELANQNGLEYARTCIRICHELGCRNLIIHPYFEGSMRRSPSTKEEEWKENLAFYGELIPLLKEYDVICCLENMWRQDWQTKKIDVGICSDMSETNRYIDALNETAGKDCFGFCLDVGHLTLLGIDSYEAIHMLGKRLVALHIHDNSGITDDHVIPYTGVTLWDRFLQGLAEVGYEGTLSFETAESQRKVPVELISDMLTYTAKIGRFFENRIVQLKEKAIV